MSVIALSYSRLSDYRQCPRKFMLKYIEKVPNFKEDESASPHLVRGSNVHKQLENYIIKKRAGEDGIPPSSLQEVEQTKPYINKVMGMFDVYPEHQIAIDENFKSVDWFSRDAWFRVIFDMIGLGNSLYLGDFKTGKIYDYEGTMEKPGQLHLAALVGMAVWEQYDRADCVYIYCDHKKLVPQTFFRGEHFEPLKEKLIEEHAGVNADKVYDPTVNQYCKWCPATKDQCPYSRKM